MRDRGIRQSSHSFPARRGTVIREQHNYNWRPWTIEIQERKIKFLYSALSCRRKNRKYPQTKLKEHFFKETNCGFAIQSGLFPATFPCKFSKTKTQRYKQKPALSIRLRIFFAVSFISQNDFYPFWNVEFHRNIK